MEGRVVVRDKQTDNREMLTVHLLRLQQLNTAVIVKGALMATQTVCTHIHTDARERAHVESV